MSGLVHISKYLNEFKLEMDKYDLELTKRAESVSAQVKKIQEELADILPWLKPWGSRSLSLKRCPLMALPERPLHYPCLV